MAKLKYKDIYKPSKNLEEFKKKHPKSKFLGLYEKADNTNWSEYNKTKLSKGGFENPKANEMAKRQRFDKLLKDQGKIRDEAQKEINKKTALDNYFETGELKRKERHEGKGRWVTMKGRRVFIEDGENPTDALNKSLAWEKKNKRRSGVNKNNRDWNK